MISPVAVGILLPVVVRVSRGRPRSSLPLGRALRTFEVILSVVAEVVGVANEAVDTSLLTDSIGLPSPSRYRARVARRRTAPAR